MDSTTSSDNCSYILIPGTSEYVVSPFKNISNQIYQYKSISLQILLYLLVLSFTPSTTPSPASTTASSTATAAESSTKTSASTTGWFRIRHLLKEDNSTIFTFMPTLTEIFTKASQSSSTVIYFHSRLLISPIKSCWSVHISDPVYFFNIMWAKL